MKGRGTTEGDDGVHLIPKRITRVSFRFRMLKEPRVTRKLRASFMNGGRKFKLHALVIYNKERGMLFLCCVECILISVDHALNMFLKWNGENYTCWRMTGHTPPVQCSGENRGVCTVNDCTDNRVLFAGYVVIDPPEVP